MRFSRFGDVYRVQRVSGPTHNMLGVRFAENPVAKPSVRSISEENADRQRLRAEDVARHVLAGIDRANSAFKLRIYPAEIEFVLSDTPPADIYALLAYKLIENMLEKKSI